MTIYCDYNRNLVYLYLGHGGSVTNLKKALLKTGSSLGKCLCIFVLLNLIVETAIRRKII